MKNIDLWLKIKNVSCFRGSGIVIAPMSGCVRLCGKHRNKFPITGGKISEQANDNYRSRRVSRNKPQDYCAMGKIR